MTERAPGDDRLAAVLRRAVGEPPYDLEEVLTRGARLQRARARRRIYLAGAVGVAAVVAVVLFAAFRSQPTTVQPTELPAHKQVAITPGSYTTRSLSTARLVQDGIRFAALQGKRTVFSLTFKHGKYRQYQQEDNGKRHVEDQGTYSLHGSKLTLVSAYRGERATLTVAQTRSGFRLLDPHFYCKCRPERRVAPVIWTTAAFRRK